MTSISGTEGPYQNHNRVWSGGRRFTTIVITAPPNGGTHKVLEEQGRMHIFPSRGYIIGVPLVVRHTGNEAIEYREVIYDLD